MKKQRFLASIVNWCSGHTLIGGSFIILISQFDIAREADGLDADTKRPSGI